MVKFKKFTITISSAIKKFFKSIVIFAKMPPFHRFLNLFLNILFCIKKGYNYDYDYDILRS